MIKLKKRLVFILFIALLILISGCKGKKSNEKSLEEIRTGTEGITMNFLANAPPTTIHVEKGAGENANSFEVVLEMRNKGAFPQPNEGTAPDGKIYLSGYDPNIINFRDTNIQDTNRKALEGKSTINLSGVLVIAPFKVFIQVDNLNVDKYEPTLLATACYFYQTVAGPSVCIDPNPYSTTNEKKVCQVQDISLSSQGAPVAITKIDEEAFATKTQFKITIKNAGNGEVIKYDMLNKCGPSGEKILREEVDRVHLQEVRIGNKELTCGPFTDTGGSAARGRGGDVRLINGEGFVICELPSSDYGSKTAYITPMTISLVYIYRNSIEKKIQIKQEVSGLGGSSGVSTPSTSSPSSEWYGPQ